MENQERVLAKVYALNTKWNNPTCIHLGKSLYFSSREKAEDVILKFKELFPHLYQDDPSCDRVHSIVLETFEMDSTHRNQLSTRVYSPQGLLIAESEVPDDGPFLGRETHHIHHEIGEIVEFPFGDRLIFGIVIGQPMRFNEQAASYGLKASDDCYAVIHHPGGEINYAHAPMVFKPSTPISKEVVEELKSAFSKQIKSESGRS